MEDEDFFHYSLLVHDKFIYKLCAVDYKKEYTGYTAWQCMFDECKAEILVDAKFRMTSYDGSKPKCPTHCGTHPEIPTSNLRKLVQKKSCELLRFVENLEVNAYSYREVHSNLDEINKRMLVAYNKEFYCFSHSYPYDKKYPDNLVYKWNCVNNSTKPKCSADLILEDDFKIPAVTFNDKHSCKDEVNKQSKEESNMLKRIILEHEGEIIQFIRFTE